MRVIQQARINISLQQVLDMLILLNARTTFGRVIDVVLALGVPIGLPGSLVVSDEDSDASSSDSVRGHSGSTGKSIDVCHRPSISH